MDGKAAAADRSITMELGRMKMAKLLHVATVRLGALCCQGVSRCGAVVRESRPLLPIDGTTGAASELPQI